MAAVLLFSEGLLYSCAVQGSCTPVLYRACCTTVLFYAVLLYSCSAHCWCRYSCSVQGCCTAALFRAAVLPCCTRLLYSCPIQSCCPTVLFYAVLLYSYSVQGCCTIPSTDGASDHQLPTASPTESSTGTETYYKEASLKGQWKF
jgi:hypothetical protein